MAGTPYPENEAALRKAKMYFYANAAAAQREQMIDRAGQAIREHEKAQYAAESDQYQAWSEASLLERMAASLLSAEQPRLPGGNGVSAVDGSGAPHRQTHSGGVR